MIKKFKGIVLIQGDCFDIFSKLDKQSITLIHTDPPYEIKTSKKQLGRIGDFTETRLGETFEKLSAKNISNGFNVDLFFKETKNLLKYDANYQIWCSKKQFLSYLKRAEENKWNWQDIHLFRTNPVPVCYHKYLDSDYCVHLWKGRSISGEYKNKFTNYSWSIGKKTDPLASHVTVKPLEPILNMIQTGSSENDVILDPFMGCGTTGVACIQTGRKFIGIEKDPEYFEMAVKRIERELSLKS